MSDVLFLFICAFGGALLLSATVITVALIKHRRPVGDENAIAKIDALTERVRGLEEAADVSNAALERLSASQAFVERLIAERSQSSDP